MAMAGPRSADTRSAGAEEVERYSRELLHQRLYRLGEANDWAANLGLPQRFCAVRGASGHGEVCCHIYEGGQFVREISLELFDRRHAKLKARWEASGKGRPTSQLAVGHARTRRLPEEEQLRRQEELCATTVAIRSLREKLELQRRTLAAVKPPVAPFSVVA